MGSTSVARRAGSQVASNAMAISKRETPANETESRGLSPKSVAESARETPAETIIPITTPDHAVDAETRQQQA
jgi:hypothetical protein